MPRALSTSEVSDFRERLCEAATHLFAEKGLEGLTLRELANELGVSAMTPYRYFRDKDEMVAAMRARAFNRFAETLEEAFNRPGNAPARANAAGEAYIRFALQDPASYRLMFDLSQPDDRYPELKAAADRARLTLTRHIHPLVEGGFLKGDPDILGHVFWAVLHGAIMLHLSAKLDPNCGLRKILDEAFRALITGFQAGEQNR